MGAFSIHSGARGPAAGAEWQRVPKWGLEYPSPSFGYKGDQREGIGRNEEGRVGVGEGREAPIQEGRTREWVGVPSLTDRPLQTHPRSAKQEHHPPWSPLFPPPRCWHSQKPAANVPGLGDPQNMGGGSWGGGQDGARRAL